VAEQEQVKHLEEVVSGLQEQVAAAVDREEGLKHEAQQAIGESVAWESKYAVVVADGQQRVEKLESELAAVRLASQVQFHRPKVPARSSLLANAPCHLELSDNEGTEI
jgi:hypothetical protein